MTWRSENPDATPEAVAAFAALQTALGVIGEQVLSGAATGVSSAWFRTLSAPIRLAVRLDAITSGQCQVTIDGSDDGITSTVQIGTFLLDTVAEKVVAPPFNANTAYLRFTVLSGTGAIASAWKGI